jgi:hypothetical protein
VFEAIALVPPVDAAHDRGGRPEGGVMLGAIRVGTIAFYFLLILFLVALAITWRWVVAGSIILGALAGVVIGFWLGEANAPPDPYGSYSIGPSDWAFTGGFVGLLIGATLGGTVGIIVRRRR